MTKQATKNHIFHVFETVCMLIFQKNFECFSTAGTELADDLQETMQTVLDVDVGAEKGAGVVGGKEGAEEENIVVKKRYEPCDMEKVVYLRNFQSHDGHTKYECRELGNQLKCFRLAHSFSCFQSTPAVDKKGMAPAGHSIILLLGFHVQ